MCRMDWGLNPKILKIIYTSGLERIILYAAEVWCPRGRPVILRFKASHMQRPVLLALTREYRTAPTDNL